MTASGDDEPSQRAGFVSPTATTMDHLIRAVARIEPEMQFVRGARRLLIDGRWKYSADPKALWVRDWNGFNAEKPPAPELDRRMQRHDRCPPPATAATPPR